MKLGFVSAILPELALEEVFRTSQELKYACVEVMCWPPGKADRRYAGVTHIDVSAFGPSEADRVRALCDTHNIAISGLGYYPNPLTADQDEAKRAADHLVKVIDASAMLGVNVVNSFVGRDPALSVEANWPRFLENLAAVGGPRRVEERADRDRELPDVVRPRRVAGRQKPRDLPGDLAEDVRRHPEPGVRPEF